MYWPAAYAMIFLIVGCLMSPTLRSKRSLSTTLLDTPCPHARAKNRLPPSPSVDTPHIPAASRVPRPTHHCINHHPPVLAPRTLVVYSGNREASASPSRLSSSIINPSAVVAPLSSSCNIG
ncbi:hypothetical protein L226DRAFT_293691 [Lentinus tigrinus ALCF2SS1-7]|uniref:uncharacterized protein n=1 Tax=Lentinus tigrinus ALCF2SS1-7 TaxID=1328758 RepID=UPI00116604CE|nr:hypothetical protein L226DRAFT_293691 [Lentinus tigrinus ALCF2SS1-7]